MDLVKKTKDEIMFSDETITGNVYIGAGETEAVRILARAAYYLQKDFPQIHIHISSGDTTDVTERLNKGLIDFGVLFDPTDLSEYNHLRIPTKDEWGRLNAARLVSGRKGIHYAGRFMGEALNHFPPAKRRQCLVYMAKTGFFEVEHCCDLQPPIQWFSHGRGRNWICPVPQSHCKFHGRKQPMFQTSFSKTGYWVKCGMEEISASQ